MMILLLFGIPLLLRSVYGFGDDEVNVQNPTLYGSRMRADELGFDDGLLINRKRSPLSFPNAITDQDPDGIIPLLLNGKYLERIIKRQRNLNMNKPLAYDVFTPSTPIRRKRQIDPDNTPPTSTTTPSTNRTTIAEKYAEDDEFLKNLQSDPNCTQKLYLCSHPEVNPMECVLNCYLSLHTVPNPSTKFLFRLMRVFVSFSQELCPTFGIIYDKIQTEILDTHHRNSLDRFLEAVGFGEDKSGPDWEEFKKYAPLNLFNNLVNHGKGDQFQVVKSILSMAMAWWESELAEMQTLPSIYSNPFCAKSPIQQWAVSMIDAMSQHPVNADIFLKGFYMMTRSLTQELPYPLDNMFASSSFAVKILAGVDCSLVSYAEQGVPFVCLEPPPIQSILEDYSKTEKEDENPLSWIVCGAHQVEIPNWEEWRKNLTNEDGGDETTTEREGNSTDSPVELDNSNESFEEVYPYLK